MQRSLVFACGARNVHGLYYSSYLHSLQILRHELRISNLGRVRPTAIKKTFQSLIVIPTFD